MKNLISIVVLSLFSIISITTCFTHQFIGTSYTNVNIASAPLELFTPYSENEDSLERLPLCNPFLKKGKKLASYASLLEDQRGKAIKISTTSFEATDGASVSLDALYPRKKDDQSVGKYLKVVGLEEMTFREIPFAYLVLARLPLSNEKEMRPSIVFRCVDKAGNGKLERIGSEEPLIVPEWLLK